MEQSEKSAEREELIQKITEEFLRLSEKYFYLEFLQGLKNDAIQ